MKCPFCDIESLKPRIFYQKGNWLGLLAAPAHSKGHSILFTLKGGVDCPNEINKLGPQIWDEMGPALKDMSYVLMKYYQPRDLLLASVRGDVRHFHFHLIPLWEKEEKMWRTERGYKERGHLLEYLGYLEIQGDTKCEKERRKKGWSEGKQRNKITEKLAPDIHGLRSVSGYGMRPLFQEKEH